MRGNAAIRGGTKTRTRLGAPGLVARHLRAGDGSVWILFALLVAQRRSRRLLRRAPSPNSYRRDPPHDWRFPPGAARPLGERIFGSPDSSGPPARYRSGDVRRVLRCPRSLPGGGIGSALRGPRASAVGGLHAAHAADLDRRPLTVHPVITLAVDLDWSARVRLLEGPADAWTGQDSDGRSQCEHADRLALSSNAAALAHLRVGGRPPGRPAPLRITALYAPKDPGDPFWVHQPDLTTGNIFQSSGGGFLLYADVSSIQSAVGLRDAWRPRRSRLVPDPGRAPSFADAGQLGAQARQVEVGGTQLTTAQSANFRGDFPDAITLVDRGSPWSRPCSRSWDPA